MSYERVVVHRAGTIPYIIDDGEIKMMFMRPSDPEFCGDVFQIAKGRIEEGENAKEAAIREAKEELGLFMGNVEFVEELGVFMGRTTVFIAKIMSQDMFGEPSFETAEVTWMTEDEFMRTGRELHRPVVQAAVRMINRLEETFEEDSDNE